MPVAIHLLTVLFFYCLFVACLWLCCRYSAPSTLRLPTRDESLANAETLKTVGSSHYGNKRYRTALKFYDDALQFVQQYIQRNSKEPIDTLMELFSVQQKVFGNIAWCLYVSQWLFVVAVCGC